MVLNTTGDVLIGLGITKVVRHRREAQQAPRYGAALAVHRQALEAARASDVTEATCAEDSTPLAQHDGPEALQVAPTAG